MTENKKETSPPGTFNSAVKLAENETEEYDPYTHRELEHPNTFSGALIHVLKSSLGTGILAIPSAVAAVGIVFGIIGTILVGMLCAHTIHLLVHASQQICKKAKEPMLGFAETAYNVVKYGPASIQPMANIVRTLVEVALVLTCYAIGAVFVVFICGNIQQLVVHYHPSTSDWPLHYFMLMILLPLIICCQVRELKHLVPFSFIANTTMMVAFVITLYYMFSGIPDIDIEDRKMFGDLTLVPLFYSTVLFAMEGICTMLPIENSMLKQQFIGCPGVLNIGMASVATLYTIIGLFGYIRFGEEVQANVIADLPSEEVPAQVAKICIAASVFFTFMLQFHVAHGITWSKIAPNVSERYFKLAEIALRVVMVMFVAAIAAAVPKLNAIIGLVGSICYSILGLFTPAAIDIILNSAEGRDFGFVKWKLWKNIFIIVLSGFGLVSGSIYAVRDLLED